MTDACYARILQSPIGPLTLMASDAGLVAIHWEDDAPAATVELIDSDDHPILDTVATQLEEYFAGERTTFDLPLDLRGTEFQVSVWRALEAVPFGETSTYGAQAEQIGRPKAVRAVGAANGRNPVPIVLPCHRIVGKDGSLTGFAGGLDTKRFLLDHEATVGGDGAPSRPVQLPLV